MVEIKEVLTRYGLNDGDFVIAPVTSGHINKTFKLTGSRNFVLQRINKEVFKNPEVIASNLRLASNYLRKNSPDYLFLAPIESDRGEMVFDEEGFPWRLFPYLADSLTIDNVGVADEAFAAAKAFGELSRRLDGIEIGGFKEVIPQFHDLSLRYRQFETAVTDATPDRIDRAENSIRVCQAMRELVDNYESLIAKRWLRLRILHNDTKINNVLFHARTRKTMAVIDLDTLMPGYFICDLGDMVRTFVSPVSEEESDFSKIKFRNQIYEALLAGYLSEMQVVLKKTEIEAIPFAGKMMTYMMALRFLTDYLNGDIYYHTTYPGQNLVRAQNQLALLKILIGAIPD